MIPLCCSTKSRQFILKKGARYNKEKDICFIDNRYKIANFEKWIPSYYLPQNKIINLKVLPPCFANDIQKIVSKEIFFNLKMNINLLNGSICRICGKKENLWIHPIWKKTINDKKQVDLKLSTVIGCCSKCCKNALGWDEDIYWISKMNHWNSQKTKNYINFQKKQKIDKKMINSINVDKIYSLI